MLLRESPKRMLVVCTRGIGDFVLATPVMRSLKHKWPDGDIHALVFEGTEGALENNRDVSRVIAVKRRATRRERLAEVISLWRRYDFAYTVTTSDRASFYCWVAGRYRAGIVPAGSQHWWKRMLFHQHAEVPQQAHMITVALAGLPLLGVEPVCHVVPPSMRAHSTSAVRLDDMLQSLGGKRFAVLQLDAMYRYKTWHTAGWIEVIAWLRNQGYGIVLGGGAQAMHNVDVASITHEAGPDAVDLVGRVSLAELAAVIGRAALYVGPDTGVSHIAAATGTPMVVLFGPSNPVSWGPWPASRRRHESPWALRGSRRVGNVFLLQGPGACVPCQQGGCERHELSRSDCLSLLSAQTVIAAATTMLGLHAAALNCGFDDGPDREDACHPEVTVRHPETTGVIQLVRRDRDMVRMLVPDPGAPSDA